MENTKFAEFRELASKICDNLKREQKPCPEISARENIGKRLAEPIDFHPAGIDDLFIW